MRQLRPGELKAVLNELQKQKTLEEYTDQKNKWAFLAAVITNGFASLACVFSDKKKKPNLVDSDAFLSKDFKQLCERIIGEQKNEKNFDKHIQDAKQKGLKGPW